MSLDQVLAEANLGEEVKAFLEGDLGKLLVGRSENDKEQAVIDLLAIDPYNYESLPALQNAIAKIQQDYRTADRIGQYLQDALFNGEIAYQQLTLNEEE